MRKPLYLVVVATCGILFAGSFPGVSSAHEPVPESDERRVAMPRSQEAAGVGASPASRRYLPMVYGPPKLSDRLGYGATFRDTFDFPEPASLRAGWYLDWSVKTKPARPNFMEYVQVVRLHQRLTCSPDDPNAWNRDACPYANPYAYDVYPSHDIIREAVRANRGALWFIGNEMDRRDWFVCANTSCSERYTSSQDEMLPEVYAVAYHELYELIKAEDPGARVAIGAVIQATPLRLQYLDRVLDSFRQRYGTEMPVDVWNVHNFILKERLNDFGASIPPGSSAREGVIYADGDHVNLSIFADQIRAFRQWMKQQGQQEKPLIVSEFGVLYWHVDTLDEPWEVAQFMLSSFDYLLNARDCAIGYPADDCRLVQKWAWYSLDDNGASSGFNRHGALFDVHAQALTEAGHAFRSYSLANMAQLQ